MRRCIWLWPLLLLLTGCGNTADRNVSIESLGYSTFTEAADDSAVENVPESTVMEMTAMSNATSESVSQNVSVSKDECVSMDECVSKDEDELSDTDILPEDGGADALHSRCYTFVTAKDSCQELGYILYLPEDYDETTPIVIFLHGDGDVKLGHDKVTSRYQFLSCLKSGDWQPGVILIAPIGRKEGNWANEADNVIAIIDEVLDTGGDAGKVYICGASAGADGMTYIAGKRDFAGAIYMAGHMNGKKEDISADAVMRLWAGKKVLYFRDNLQKRGGYGYNKDFFEECQALAPQYNVTFSYENLDWNHDIGLVDAALLPQEYIDDNGNSCHNGLGRLLNN